MLLQSVHGLVALHERNIVRHATPGRFGDAAAERHLVTLAFPGIYHKRGGLMSTFHLGILPR